MASTRAPMFFLPLLLVFLLPASSSGEVVCEDLPRDLCSFSISASSMRCVLESTPGENGKGTEYQCRTSEVDVANGGSILFQDPPLEVAKMANWVESDECITACGVDRNTVGISSDSLMESEFTSKLCSNECFEGCPNIVDLYFNLAAGEGVYLPNLCDAIRSNPHRAMVELMSSGAAMDGGAPASSPSA